MKGYKATYDFKCKHLTFEIGKVYTHEGDLIPCEQGLYFCKNPDDLLDYYPYKSNLKILEIEVLGDVIDDYNKSVTNKLKVLREIPFIEWNDIFTKYSFTKKNNEIEVKEKFSNGNSKKWIYDESGNLIKTEYPYDFWEKSTYDENNNKIKFENSDGYWKKYCYDENNNQIKFEDSDGNWKKYCYDENGNKIYYEDSYGYWKKFNYNESGNLIKTDDSNNYWEKWIYDENNDLIKTENLYD